MGGVRPVISTHFNRFFSFQVDVFYLNAVNESAVVLASYSVCTGQNSSTDPHYFDLQKSFLNYERTTSTLNLYLRRLISFLKKFFCLLIYSLIGWNNNFKFDSVFREGGTLICSLSLSLSVFLSIFLSIFHSIFHSLFSTCSNRCRFIASVRFLGFTFIYSCLFLHFSLSLSLNILLNLNVVV